MLPQASPAAFGVRAQFDAPAQMRDGVTLRATIYRPDDGGAGAFPVLLSRTPYGKDLPGAGAPIDPAQAARRGYIVVVQDVRGRFASEGEWTPLVNEGADGYDSVQWAAGLPGANGAVGMFGGSYVGFTQWAAAVQRPPALRAIAPMVTWDDVRDGVAYRDGALELGLQGSWNLMLGIDQLMRRNRENPQALGAAMYGLVNEANRLPAAGYRDLPLDTFGPLARLGLDEPMRLATGRRDDADYLRATGVAHAYGALRLPALHIGGWYDIFLNGTIRNFQRMREQGLTNQWLVIGPWTHSSVNGVQGELDFGYAASGALLDLQTDLMSLHLRFFDATLRDDATAQATLAATLPPVKYFVMGANVWRGAESWPPAGVSEQRWYLHSQGEANTLDGDGALSPEPPAAHTAEIADTYVYDPSNPVPTAGGATLMHPLFPAGPRDQRPNERRRDVLVYTSAPLAEPLEVTGPVRVALSVASSAPDTDFVARLVDVYPDGAAQPITDGILRMSAREGLDHSAPPLRPTEAYSIEIDLWSTSVVFQPGHRIRLEVTSSNFPRWSRNLNTGADSATTTAMQPARQTVLHDSECPSYLRLPVMR